MRIGILGGGRLGLFYKLAVLVYILAVVILSYREGMTVYAKGAGLLLLGQFLFRITIGGERIFLPIEMRVLVGWFILGVLSSAFSKDPATALPRIVTIAQVIPLGLILCNFIVWNGEGRFYWWSVLGAGVLSGALTLLSPQSFTGIDGRVFGTLGNANAFAAMLATGVAIGASTLVGSSPLWVRGIGLASAAFFLYLVGETGSRMGMLACLAAVVVIFICYQMTASVKRIGRLVAISVVGVSLVVGSLSLISSSQFVSRLEALTSAAEKGDFGAVGDNSLRDRAMLYRKAFELTLENPLIGVGLDVFRTADIRYRTIGNNSHSNYLEILASTGIVGAILYFSMYFFWWRRLLYLRPLLRDEKLAGRYALSLAVAAQFLIFDLAWVNYYEKLAWVFLAGLIAESHLLLRSVRQETRRLAF